jgi:hypothetical protein
VSARWELTVRSGSRVTHDRYATLDEALGALADRAAELAPTAERKEVRFLARRIDPERQVAARLEVSGGGGLWRAAVAGGVDLRGDGSSEAYTGRLRRSVVKQRRGETAVDALRRVLSE